MSIGSARFLRAVIALFLAGLVTFGVLYSVQPLLPGLAARYRVVPAVSSLALTLTTMALAVGMPLAGALSDRVGRKPVMVAGVIGTAVLAMACALAPNLLVLLVLRALLGLTLSGLPSIAMTYLGEEVAGRGLGLAMGLSIGGNAVGGMGGRLLAGLLADLVGEPAAMAGIGVLACVCAAAFTLLLPASQRFRPGQVGVRSLARAFGEHLGDGIQRRLFSEGALLMGGFVTLYTYLGFRMVAAPYDLSQSLVGLLFLVYVVGVFASAGMGQLSERWGRHRVLPAAILVMAAGVTLTLVVPAILIVVGVALATAGFFGAHSVASSWVSERAVRGRAQATAAYLFCYYVGSSLGGTLGGLAWRSLAWGGVVLFVDALLGAALVLAVALAWSARGRKPEPAPGVAVGAAGSDLR